MHIQLFVRRKAEARSAGHGQCHHLHFLLKVEIWRIFLLIKVRVINKYTYVCALTLSTKRCAFIK